MFFLLVSSNFGFLFLHSNSVKPCNVRSFVRSHVTYRIGTNPRKYYLELGSTLSVTGLMQCLRVLFVKAQYLIRSQPTGHLCSATTATAAAILYTWREHRWSWVKSIEHTHTHTCTTCSGKWQTPLGWITSKRVYLNLDDSILYIYTKKRIIHLLTYKQVRME